MSPTSNLEAKSVISKSLRLGDKYWTNICLKRNSIVCSGPNSSPFETPPTSASKEAVRSLAKNNPVELEITPLPERLVVIWSDSFSF